MDVISRRYFSELTIASLAGFPLTGAAQERFIDGKHYVAVSPRQPTRDLRQVEVLEFFAYACSHCSAFEPTLDAWQRKLPRDVLFRRIPVAFRGDLVAHQKLFFAIESMGLVEQLHGRVFNAIHVDKQRLTSMDEIGKIIAKSGVDQARFIDSMNSFTVAGKVKQASMLAEGYKIEGTPAIGVDGRWLTSGSMAGSNPLSLRVSEQLIGLAKKTG